MKKINTLRKAVVPFAAAMAFVSLSSNAQAQDCLVDFNVNAGCNAPGNGWASVTGIGGGTTPYAISWSTGQTNLQYVENFANGSYSVTVTDGLSCAVTKSFDILCNEDKVENCQFRTQTQGGWGTTANGNNPGTYRDAHFAGAFPNGLTIGCTNKIRLTTTAAVDAFLQSSTTARALNAGTLMNPGQTYKNVLAGQLVALTLSVRFDQVDADFSPSSQNLADAEILIGTFQGWTVQMLLDEANNFIGGCPANFTASQLNSALTMINENYVDGTTDNGNLACKKGDGKSLSLTTATNVYPNPASETLSVDLSATEQGSVTITLIDATGRVALPVTRTGVAKGEKRTVNIDLNGLTNGTYLLSVEQNGTHDMQRVVIAR